MRRYDQNSSIHARKALNEKNLQILRTLLKESGNKYCADCKTNAHPRWASWNLGIFICIRCSGIHRSMGTHISRVKSIDLDSWTEEQMQSMIQWGNEKANLFWEDKLPLNYTPDESKIENFIRTKYALKKWAASKEVPNPSTLKGSRSKSSENSTSPHNQQQKLATNNNHSGSIGNSSESKSRYNHSQRSNQPPRIQTKPQQQPKQSLLDFGDFVSAPSSVSTPIQSSATQDLLSLTAPNNSSTPTSGATINTTTTNARPDLKKSILSLYSSPLTPTNQTFSNSLASPQHIQPSIGNGNNDLLSGLSGLSISQQQIPSSLSPQSLAFNNTQYSAGYNNSNNTINNNNNTNNNNNAAFSSLYSQLYSSNASPNKETISKPSTNEWSTQPSLSSRSTATGSNLLEDEVFGNVWK